MGNESCAEVGIHVSVHQPRARRPPRTGRPPARSPVAAGPPSKQVARDKSQPPSSSLPISSSSSPRSRNRVLESTEIAGKATVLRRPALPPLVGTDRAAFLAGRLLHSFPPSGRWPVRRRVAEMVAEAEVMHQQPAPVLEVQYRRCVAKGAGMSAVAVPEVEVEVAVELPRM
ncbi:hypothetical protein ZWY2020_059253, partial [Hordeum vulgare]